jgi:hypothetical protein
VKQSGTSSTRTCGPDWDHRRRRHHRRGHLARGDAARPARCWSSSATLPGAPAAAPASWCTAGCATSKKAHRADAHLGAGAGAAAGRRAGADQTRSASCWPPTKATGQGAGSSSWAVPVRFAGLQWSHTYYDARDFHMLAPHLRQRLQGGFTLRRRPDRRRPAGPARHAGSRGRRRHGPQLRARDRPPARKQHRPRRYCRDKLTGDTQDVRGRAVANATGAWADRLRGRSALAPGCALCAAAT